MASTGLPMNSPAPNPLPLGPELTAQLLAIAGSHCEQAGGCHGPDHAERVHQLALHIGRQLEAKLKILSAAAILHDIGRREESASQGRICHAAEGARKAAGILAELGFAAAEQAEIIHCIATHRYRGEAVPLSLEAQILYDADKLDSIGATGIGRAFLFAGQVGAKLHNRSRDLAGSQAYSLEDTAYREYKVKLSRIKERMLTGEGRRLAEERDAFMATFFRQLTKEVDLTAQSC